MALWDAVTRLLAIEPMHHPPVIQARAAPEGSLLGFAERMAGLRTQAWRSITVDSALSVPAIFRAVTLISNTVGALSMRAFRDGAELSPGDRPRLIVRPNPFTTPREFFRETAWSMAAYGEAWWWVGARDVDGQPLSLFPVNPREIVVSRNTTDPRYPTIAWRSREMAQGEMIQIKMTGETGALRGSGPLQRCGAAVSVSVEAQEWAANYFAEDGGIPSIIIKAASQLTKDEADDLLNQWMSKGHNLPRIIDNAIDEVKEFGANTQGAQMLDARLHQNGEAANMFGIPGELLQYGVQGGSITYQNVGQQFEKLVTVCLQPDYLEPIEQAMTDQLTRSTTAEFNTAEFERADVKTQAEVAALLFEKEVIDRDEARSLAGFVPDIENAAVPFSPPQAIPDSFPAARSASDVRCSNCGRFLAELATIPYRLRCRDCKSLTIAA